MNTLSKYTRTSVLFFSLLYSLYQQQLTAATNVSFPKSPHLAYALEYGQEHSEDEQTVRLLLNAISQYERTVQYLGVEDLDVEFTTMVNGKKITLTLYLNKVIYDFGNGRGGEFAYTYNRNQALSFLRQFRTGQHKTPQALSVKQKEMLALLFAIP